jgi:hypothetical protein
LARRRAVLARCGSAVILELVILEVIGFEIIGQAVEGCSG